MDGIVIDQNGSLSVTPLNVTLGIFNTETRGLSQAWETIYFHPDSSYEKEFHSKNASPIEGVQNLHHTLEAALDSFHAICEVPDGIPFNFLHYAGKNWQVRLKFGIAFVVGDTELHDKLCGKYQSRSHKVQMLCRHCDCPTQDIVDPLVQKKTRLFLPSHLDPCNEDLIEGYFKSISHYPIQNAFHKLDFGSNPNHTHLATPGECLHMHQLGVAKRAIQAFNYLVQGNVDDVDGPVSEKKKKGSKDALEDISLLAKAYGGHLSRQSDRDFPRTKFGSSILSTTKKEGHDYQGMLLGLLIALLSDRGREIMLVQRKMVENRIVDQVHMIELIISMEEWLKKGKPTRRELGILPTVMMDFISKVNFNCQRGGMGTKLIKNHLYFHLPKYIELWGLPKGWNLAPNESHHKTEVKAPARNTQKRPGTLAKQTTLRYYEKRILEKATRTWGLSLANNVSKTHQLNLDLDELASGGSRFEIRVEDERKPVMVWWDSQKRDKPKHPQVVLQFCVENVMSVLKGNVISCFTEYNVPSKKNQLGYTKYRAHPSYCSDSGQVSGVWYDWAMFKIADKVLPGQILTFFQTGELVNQDVVGDNVDDAFHKLKPNKSFAVVRTFKDVPQNFGNKFFASSLVQWGELACDLKILDCTTIRGPCFCGQEY